MYYIVVRKNVNLPNKQFFIARSTTRQCSQIGTTECERRFGVLNRYRDRVSLITKDQYVEFKKLQKEGTLTYQLLQEKLDDCTIKCAETILPADVELFNQRTNIYSYVRSYPLVSFGELSDWR